MSRNHVSRFTFHVSRFTFHVSRITPIVHHPTGAKGPGGEVGLLDAHAVLYDIRLVAYDRATRARIVRAGFPQFHMPAGAPVTHPAGASGLRDCGLCGLLTKEGMIHHVPKETVEICTRHPGGPGSARRHPR